MGVETRFYELLGVSCDASHDDIRKSYRQAAMRWHPDRNPDDPDAVENFKACLEAYEVLSDPEKRAAYDSLGLGGIRQSAESSSSSSYQPRQQQQQQQQQWKNSYFTTYDSPASATPFPNLFEPSWDPCGMPAFQSFHESVAAHAQTHAPAQARELDDQLPRGYPSWSYQMSSSSSSSTAADGSYSTQFHSWNNIDGHRSGSRSGTIGDGGFESADGFGFVPGSGAGFNNGNLFSSFGQGPSNLFTGTNMNTGREASPQRTQSYSRGQWWT